MKLSGTAMGSKYSRKMIKMASTQKRETTNDWCRKANRYVGGPGKARKMKRSENEAMGRVMRRV